MDDQYISGIFNYCDRWCERCAFTARCRTYTMEQEFHRAEREGRDPRDIDWEAFWRCVGLSFERTPAEWLSDGDFDSEEPEFDLGISFRSAAADEERLLDEAADAHPLNVRAHDYRAAAHRWLFDHAINWLNGRSHGLDSQGAGDTCEREHPNDSLDVSDALAVIAWYHTLLAAKLNRAISGLLESRRDVEPWRDAVAGDAWGDDDFEEAAREARASDAAGSAKVALISIERSIGAWTVIRTARPDLERSIAPLQQLLGSLRVQIDRLIPYARTFHRPGFDD